MCTTTGSDMARRAPAPDRAALEIAHRSLRNALPLDDMLKVASLRRVVETLARRHMKNRMRIDVKMLQANDSD